MTDRTLTMPRLGETMEEGVIVGWLVALGTAFKRGDPILELETDKTVVEYPALGDGVLTEVLVGEGDRVPVGAPIARVSVSNAADWADEAGSAEEAAPVPEAVMAPVASVPRPAGEKLRATPLARRIARQNGVALETVQGTGRRGRIERRDVEGAGTAPADRLWLDTRAGRIAYTVAGTTGQTHLLIHGFAGDRTAWANLAAGLARAGHRAVALDLPAHGLTTIPADGLGPLVDAATALAETLPGKLVLIGHSLGAAVATAVAGRLGPKVSQLVLLTPAGCGPQIGAAFVQGMARATTTGEVSHLLRLLGPKGSALSEAALAQLASEMARGRLTALADVLSTADGRQRIDILRPLATLADDLPIRAVFGLDDRIVSPADALNLPPRVASHFLPTGHMPQWDAPRDLAELILKGA